MPRGSAMLCAVTGEREGLWMRAAWYERCGPANEVLAVGEMEAPRPGPGEVLVRLCASGINSGDTKKRSDWMGFGIGCPRVIPTATTRERRVAGSVHLRLPGESRALGDLPRASYETAVEWIKGCACSGHSG